MPTSEEAEGEDADSLTRKLDEGFARFETAGVDADVLRRQCLLTPSCGMGSLSPVLADRILGLLSEVSARARV